MAESVESSTPRLATELPSKYLPAVGYRDLPEPRGLRRYMGASIILTATALGSGELVLWPYITTQVGLGIVWLAVVGITMQFFLNMEIERYTLITGETAVTGFSRMWLPWGIVFVLGAILPNAWPGWASSGATVFTFIFNLSESAVPLIATIFLISIGLAVTISPVIYQTLEKVEGFMIALILIFVVAAIALATTGEAWAQVVTDIPEVTGNLPAVVAQLGAASLFGAIVFAGAGGANNLVQSNYIRDKGMGMGINIPNIVSPVTGQEVAAPSLGYMVPSTKENERRWRQWWRIANWEQLITFWFIGALLLGLPVRLGHLDDRHEHGPRGRTVVPPGGRPRTGRTHRTLVHHSLLRRRLPDALLHQHRSHRLREPARGRLAEGDLPEGEQRSGARARSTSRWCGS